MKKWVLWNPWYLPALSPPVILLPCWSCQTATCCVAVPENPTSLKAFGVPLEDLDGLVEAGLQVQRLLVNNMRLVTAEDARNLYLEIL
ncbi:hypothetical protein [Lacrimispora sp.]|uniref:hypothetical protein n=1 Tax=Lacrimispora sp. TaxID=2719234 RepID=UPI002F4104FD